MKASEAEKARFVRSLNKPVNDLHLLPPSRTWRATRHVRALGDRLLELRYSRDLDTAEDEIRLDHFHPDRVTYQASSWRFLPRVLRRHDVVPGDVFVDLGAGKGRVVYQAARYPFARVIGVEIVPDLAEVARRNIEHNRGRLSCPNVEIVTADAAEYRLPDEVTVAYLYHPFAGATFRAVVDRLVDSLERQPRHMRLIYACPAMERELLSWAPFTLERKSRGGLADHINRRVCLYVHEP